MRVLEKLTFASLRENKRRTIVTVIGVMLSTALILAVAGIASSFQRMMINFSIAETGNYHDMFQEVPVEALKYIETNQHVAGYYYSQPVTAKEVGEDDYAMFQQHQHTPYPVEYYEKLETLPHDAQGTYNIYVRYDQPRKYEEIRRGILEALEANVDYDINYRTNRELLRYEAFAMNDSSLATLYSMAAIVIGIIVVTSVFVIRNSFSISATERMRQFGMLSSIGATPKQIRHNVYFEGVVIGLFGIPLGIILGVAAVAILVVIINLLLQDMLEIPVAFSMPLWSFAIATILSVATIFLSSLSPAIRASRMPAIEAIRGNQDVKIKAKKLRTPKFIRRTFGIGGVIADKNLKRSRKKYRTTVVSIVLSVATFIGLYSFMSYGRELTDMQFSSSKVDYAVASASPEFYQELQEKFHLQDSAYYLSTRITGTQVYVMQQPAFEKFAQSLGVREKDYSRVAIMNPLELRRNSDGSSRLDRVANIKDGEKYTVSVSPYGAIPYDCRVTYESESNVYYGYDNECYYQAVGYPKDIELTITKVTEEWPIGYDNGQYWPMIFVPENYYRRGEIGVIVDQEDKLATSVNFLESTLYAENIENGPEISQYIDEQVKLGKVDSAVEYQDAREAMSQIRRTNLLISIFLYGFIAVVALIGVTNIFNTITTNIALRTKEFAMLKSVGMTSKEFNRMIRLESLMYAGKALLIGIPLGLLLSFGFYKSVANSVDFGWIIPWAAIIFSALAVGLLIGVIMRYSVKQVNKQNLIDAIRSENI